MTGTEHAVLQLLLDKLRRHYGDDRIELLTMFDAFVTFEPRVEKPPVPVDTRHCRDCKHVDSSANDDSPCRTCNLATLPNFEQSDTPRVEEPEDTEHPKRDCDMCKHAFTHVDDEPCCSCYDVFGARGVYHRYWEPKD